MLLNDCIYSWLVTRQLCSRARTHKWLNYQQPQQHCNHSKQMHYHSTKHMQLFTGQCKEMPCFYIRDVSDDIAFVRGKVIEIFWLNPWIESSWPDELVNDNALTLDNNLSLLSGGCMFVISLAYRSFAVEGKLDHETPCRPTHASIALCVPRTVDGNWNWATPTFTAPDTELDGTIHAWMVHV